MQYDFRETQSFQIERRFSDQHYHRSQAQSQQHATRTNRQPPRDFPTRQHREPHFEDSNIDNRHRQAPPQGEALMRTRNRRNSSQPHSMANREYREDLRAHPQSTFENNPHRADFLSYENKIGDNFMTQPLPHSSMTPSYSGSQHHSNLMRHRTTSHQSYWSEQSHHDVNLRNTPSQTANVAPIKSHQSFHDSGPSRNQPLETEANTLRKTWEGSAYLSADPKKQKQDSHQESQYHLPEHRGFGQPPTYSYQQPQSQDPASSHKRTFPVTNPHRDERDLRGQQIGISPIDPKTGHYHYEHPMSSRPLRPSPQFPSHSSLRSLYPQPDQSRSSAQSSNPSRAGPISPQPASPASTENVNVKRQKHFLQDRDRVGQSSQSRNEHMHMAPLGSDRWRQDISTSPQGTSNAKYESWSSQMEVDPETGPRHWESSEKRRSYNIRDIIEHDYASQRTGDFTTSWLQTPKSLVSMSSNNPSVSTRHKPPPITTPGGGSIGGRLERPTTASDSELRFPPESHQVSEPRSRLVETEIAPAHSDINPTTSMTSQGGQYSPSNEPTPTSPTFYGLRGGDSDYNSVNSKIDNAVRNLKYPSAPTSPSLGSQSQLGKEGYYRKVDLEELYALWRSQYLLERKEVSEEVKPTTTEDTVEKGESMSSDGIDKNEEVWQHRDAEPDNGQSTNKNIMWRTKEGSRSLNENEQPRDEMTRSSSLAKDSSNKNVSNMVRFYQGNKNMSDGENFADSEEEEDEGGTEEENEDEDEDDLDDDGEEEDLDDEDDLGDLEEGEVREDEDDLLEEDDDMQEEEYDMQEEGIVKPENIDDLQEDGMEGNSDEMTQNEPGNPDSDNQDFSTGITDDSAKTGILSLRGNPRRMRVLESKNHRCLECGKRFSRPSQLKPHQCPMCQKHFNVASNLKRHIRTHTSTKRKSLHGGSMVFRSFPHSLQVKLEDSVSQPSSSSATTTNSAQPPQTSSSPPPPPSRTTLQPSERLRWVSTETPSTGSIAATHRTRAAKQSKKLKKGKSDEK
ncbi:hypothetical protein BGZ49_002579 [Haplosporangium sp. Z 27]|nr:hypothetical protein BGZ49_002579 [Haplosporangium sp. Z 27]